MKISPKYFLIIGFAATIFSCKKDNYSPPNATLNGALLYNNDSIYVEKNAVHFQLYQYGFGRVGPVSTDETFAQNGTYSALLFDGDYKLIVPNGDGPFMWPKTAGGAPDSIAITMKGSQSVNLQVTPYYMVRNTQITASGGNVNATFSIEKVVTDPVNAKDVESVTLYINQTQFVSGGNQIATARKLNADIIDMSNITLSVAVPTLVPAQNYVYARVGLKIAGVEDLLFSPLFQVQL